MRSAVLTIGCVIGLLVTSVLIVPEGEVARLSTFARDGSARETEVWVVDGDHVPGGENGSLFLRAHSARATWLARLRQMPEVELERGDEVRPYRAELPDPGALRERLNRAMAVKYGVADRLLAMLLDPSRSVPVLLVPDPARQSARRATEEHARPQ